MPATAEGISRARRRIAAHVRQWQLLEAETLSDLELLCSEIITNAITHTKASCAVYVQQAGKTVRIEVTDHDPTWPNPTLPDAHGEDGRGLILVSELATAWGVSAGPAGKTVWIECGPLQGPAESNSSA